MLKKFAFFFQNRGFFSQVQLYQLVYCTLLRQQHIIMRCRKITRKNSQLSKAASSLLALGLFFSAAMLTCGVPLQTERNCDECIASAQSCLTENGLCGSYLMKLEYNFGQNDYYGGDYYDQPPEGTFIYSLKTRKTRKNEKNVF